jgi:hypothetical protein
MPARPPLTNTTKCEIGYSGPAGTSAKNIFYVETSGDISSLVNLATLATDLSTGLGSAHANFATLLNDVWTLDGVTCIDNSGETENTSEYSIDASGTMSGQPYPPQVSVALSWTINAHYRGGHPRWYLPPPGASASSVAGGPDIAGGNVTTYEAAGNTFLAYVNALTVATFTVTMGTISYRTGNAPRATPVFRAFQACRVSPRLDTQRRRLGKEPRFS